MDLSIGQLSRLTGVPVKTIRYYSDIGLVAEASRSEAGYRRYDETSLARLELVRALRELGLDLDTAGRVAQRHTELRAAARAHADAVDAQIRQLTLRRTVLRALARGQTTVEEVHRMTAFARASADEARRLMEDFLAAVFAGNPGDPFAERMRGALPDLPAEPTDAQIDAWVELADLVSDHAFRARVKQMVDEGARMRAATNVSDTDRASQAAGAEVVKRASAALAQGVRPDSDVATAIVDRLVAGFAAAAHERDTPAYRARLLEQLRMFSDGRVERYWQLIGVINAWPEQPSIAPAYEWFIAALEHSVRR
ncbi:MAG: MerR family transcriptional regulator [Candidatus Dormibacteraeota bacterium]|nr:MerR family transcriptional regulator [Candidatus Dormibacteraeota bacterium]MBV9524651.1 MerR family transcriptional regulator [Candidatus Dormibacteraeota bacterium]